MARSTSLTIKKRILLLLVFIAIVIYLAVDIDDPINLVVIRFFTILSNGQLKKNHCQSKSPIYESEENISLNEII